MPDDPAPAPPSAASDAAAGAPVLTPYARPAPLTSAERDEVARAEQVLHEVLDANDAVLREHAGDVTSTMKDDGTLVSPEDEAASERLEAALGGIAGHDVLSEEAATSFGGVEWTWVVDPIDGTSNFVAGLPYWCTSVALLRRGEPVLAAISMPVVGTRVTAVLGEGCRRDGRSVAVLEGHDLADRAKRHTPMFVTGGTIRRATGWAAIKPRIMGAAALDLAFVAAGVAVASVAQDPKVWDLAAGALLVTEAGGTVTALGGEPPFPLEVGHEYVADGRPTIAGPGLAWLQALVERVGITPRW